MIKRYIPNAGDVVWLHFDRPDATGQEKKTAVVLSPSTYNKKTGLMVCCPITAQIKGYPFEVLIGTADNAAALSDQVKSINWANSKISHRGRVSSVELAQIRAKLHALVFKG
ncbi:MAG TPA: endoribonuclease MazF [Paralcaligenes sp.]|jgi:mRNA interferase MazF